MCGVFCVSLCVYQFALIYEHVNVDVCRSVHAIKCKCVYVGMCMCVCACIFFLLHVCKVQYIYLCACKCMHMCMRVYEGM